MRGQKQNYTPPLPEKSKKSKKKKRGGRNRGRRPFEAFKNEGGRGRLTKSRNKNVPGCWRRGEGEPENRRKEKNKTEAQRAKRKPFLILDTGEIKPARGRWARKGT